MTTRKNLIAYIETFYSPTSHLSEVKCISRQLWEKAVGDTGVLWNPSNWRKAPKKLLYYMAESIAMHQAKYLNNPDAHMRGFYSRYGCE